MEHSLPPKAPVALGTAHQQQLLAAGLRGEGRSDHNGKNPGVSADLLCYLRQRVWQVLMAVAVGGMKLTPGLWGTVSFSPEGQEHPGHRRTDF